MTFDLSAAAAINPAQVEKLWADNPGFIAAIEKLHFDSAARNIPNISFATAKFLQGLLLKHQPQQILEIGTANGVSTLQLALAAQSYGGAITTYDISTPSFTEANQRFIEFKLNHCITSRFGNALNELPKYQNERFDFIFIDGEKKSSLDFFLLASRFAAPNALIVIDDVKKWAGKMSVLYAWLEKKQYPHIFIDTDPDDALMLLPPLSPNLAT